MGRMPGMQGWVPYPDLLRRLTGQVRGDELKYADQQKAETARFIRQVLYTLRGEPTVVTHPCAERAQPLGLAAGRHGSSRTRSSLATARCRISRCTAGACGSSGSGTASAQETPQWWAPEARRARGPLQGPLGTVRR